MTSPARIADFNDRFRMSFIGGKVFITEGVRALGPDFESAAVEAVQSFTAFDVDNDPYAEHDFGTCAVGAETVFWKIDYYDAAFEFGSEDPADVAKTGRILTIMLRNEY